MLEENGVYILISVISILLIMGIATSLIKSNDSKSVDEDDKDEYDHNLSSSNMVNNLNKSKMVNKVTPNAKKNKHLIKLFDNAKNPWGLTPTIFQAIRILSLSLGSFLALMIFVMFNSWQIALLVLGLGILGWWYPLYYYKAIAKEREQEWDKIYEFIWVIKNSSVLYDAKKTCLETRDYIKLHAPQYEEIINGFNDFHEHWDDDKIPDYILKYYNFAVPKELYTLLFNMNITGIAPEQNLNNIRAFALNKHNNLIQSTLSGVPSKATLATLPFLMISVVLALLVPMVKTMLDVM